MRRITIWVVSTISALILLFSYRTSTMGPGGGPVAAAGPVGGDGATATGPDNGSATGSEGGSTTGDSSAGGSTSGGGRTYDGSVADTRWGPVQVRITVAGGRITDVTTPQLPNGNFRDQRINGYAVPILNQETLQAQNAHIDTVSGATVTSDGYRESLQAALDAAHLR